MCAAIELAISTFLLFCPKYSTNSPSGPTRYMMIVWSTWRQQEVNFRQRYFPWFAALLWQVGWETSEQFVTHDVVVVFVSWSLTVINSVGSGDLLDLRLCSRQADQLRGKLWKRNYAYIWLEQSITCSSSSMSVWCFKLWQRLVLTFKHLQYLMLRLLTDCLQFDFGDEGLK